MTLIVENIIRLDIETVPLWSSEEEALSSNPDLYGVFNRKYQSKKPDNMSDWDRYREHSALFSEFSKIVCISIGRYKEDLNVAGFKVRSFYWEDEKDLLTKFTEIINTFDPTLWRLWGHNIKWFDISWIAKRLIINWMKVPQILNVLWKKPREIQHIDTQEVRKFGRNVSTSLEVMCIALGIDTPKWDIDGKKVKTVFYDPTLSSEEKEKIITDYCSWDVIASFEAHKYIRSCL